LITWRLAADRCLLALVLLLLLLLHGPLLPCPADAFTTCGFPCVCREWQKWRGGSGWGQMGGGRLRLRDGCLHEVVLTTGAS
jgi:hypothetical protein